MTALASGPPTASPRSRLRRVLDLLFGVDQPVDRLAYTTSGFALMVFKYSVEAIVIFAFTGGFLRP